MERESDNRRSVSRTVSQERIRTSFEESGPSRRGADLHSQDNKRKRPHTPHDSPTFYQRSSQLSGCSRRDTKTHEQESNKRKTPCSYSESPDKIRRTPQSGKFINTLIGQWTKQIGMPTPSSAGRMAGTPLTKDEKQNYAINEKQIQVLQKKLQNAEETISSLLACRDEKVQMKEGILSKLNAIWESIDITTKYCNDISESLTEFQQHYSNLSTLYNSIINVQESVVKKLQQEVANMKLNDEEKRKLIAEAESKVTNQEKRMHEMVEAQEQLKKQLVHAKNELASEKRKLEDVHAEEKLAITKEKEEILSRNEELHQQLQKFEEEQHCASELLKEKDGEISKLLNEISTCQNKIEELLSQNTELTAIYEKSAEREQQLSKQLQTELEEIRRLRENLNDRKEIETTLAKDIDMIERRFKEQKDKHTNLQNDFVNVENQLKEAQVCNSNLENRVSEITKKKEQKVAELNKKIGLLEEEKKKLLSENRKKLQNTENLSKSLQEKHEKEITELKREHKTKLNEMEKAIATKDSAYTKLNEDVIKVKEECEKLREKIKQIKEQEKLESELKSRLESKLDSRFESNIESVLKDVDKMCENRVEAFENNYKSTQNELKNTLTLLGQKDNIATKEQEQLYNFNLIENSSELENVTSPISQYKKVLFNAQSQSKESKNKPDNRKFFKLRGSQPKQYGKTNKKK